MATVFRRDNSPYWFACYPDRNGKTAKKSTKATDRVTALRMAIEWEGIEASARSGTITAAAFQKVVSEISERVIGESLPSQSVREYFDEWLTSIQRKSSPGTQERYRNTSKKFLKSLGKVADQPLRSLTPRHVEMFLNQRLDEGLAPYTAIVDVKSMSCALERARRYGYLDRNPVEAVKLPKSVSSQREAFTLEEIHRLVAAAPNEDWQTLILLGALAGVRIGDCVKLTWDNILPDSKMLVMQQEKTGRTVGIPLHADLLVHLGRLSEGGTVGPLCRSLATKKQSGKQGLSECFKRIVVRAGLDLMEVQGKGIRKFTRRTFHALRHTFTSLLAGHGVSEELRMRLTGHSSRDIHQRYTHLTTDTLQSAIDAIPAKVARSR